MTLLNSIILAIVQGITEFLPVSSSGHLTLFQYILNTTPSLSFDIFLNTASLLTVFVYFAASWRLFIKDFKYIIIGSIPAAIVGLLFKPQLESLFSSPKYLPLFFGISALILFASRYLVRQDKKLTYQKALIIGLFQSLAILPGVTRSGSTIVAGLLLGLPATMAFQFSFFLFIPASFGALLLELRDNQFSQFFNLNYFIAFLITFFVGLLSLKILKKSIQSQHLWYFSIYLVILAVILFLSLQT